MMRIQIDIGHPAHVHYFRNLIKILESKGNSVFVTSRDKEVSLNLLNKYNIPFISRGKGRNGYMGKFIYLFEGSWVLLKNAVKFKPDLFFSFGSPYLAIVAFLLRKPNISFDDTENAKLDHIIWVPISAAIFTPNSYLKYFGKKHIKYAGFIELSSLHPKYFKLDNSVLDMMGLKSGEKFIILRFVSWQASHDFGITGLNIQMKIKLVVELSKHMKVFISSEGNLPDELSKYKLTIPPERIHDVLALATLYIGEGATMASECAMLGTPAIYVNKLDAGTLREQAEYGLLLNLRDSSDIIEKAVALISRENLKEEWQEKRQKMLSEKIDVTAYMVWLLENYPNSFSVLKSNTDFQYNFK